jgi:hypothetical protein
MPVCSHLPNAERLAVLLIGTSSNSPMPPESALQQFGYLRVEKASSAVPR